MSDARQGVQYSIILAHSANLLEGLYILFALISFFFLFLARDVITSRAGASMLMGQVGHVPPILMKGGRPW